MNKFVLSSLIISIIVLTSTYLYQNSNFQENNVKNQDKTLEKTIFQRSDFKKHTILKENMQNLKSSDSDYNIFTYSVNLGLAIEENDSEEQRESYQKNEVSTLAHIMVDYLEELQQFQIIVAYSKFNQETITSDSNDFQEMQNQNGQEETYVYDNTLVYKLLVEENSGEIMKMWSPIQKDPNQFMEWGTQELVNNIFPDIRKNSYENSAPVEKDSIGQYQPHIEEIFETEEIAQLQKHYDTKDYFQFQVDGVIAPAVDYERTLYVDQNSGIVLGGESEYEYTIGEGNQNTVSTDGEVIMQSSMSQFDIEIETHFYLQSDDQYSRQQAQNLFNFINNSELQYEEVQLAKDKQGKNQFIEEDGEFQNQNQYEPEYLDGELVVNSEKFDGESQKIRLQDSKLLYSKTINLIQFTVLSQRVKLNLISTIRSSQTSVSAKIQVNGRNIKTLYTQSLSHCYNFNKNYPKTITVPLFRASWPVGGLVTVPVKASAKFTYGVKLNGTKGSKACSYSITPNVKAVLYGDGRASLAGVISAGLYAKGTFLNSALKLAMTLTKSTGKIGLSLKGTLQPASFQFGGVYKMITCDAKKILKFKWKNVCKRGADKFHPFVKKSTKKITKTFWTANVKK